MHLVEGWVIRSEGKSLHLALRVEESTCLREPAWLERHDVATPHGEQFMISGYRRLLTQLTQDVVAAAKEVLRAAQWTESVGIAGAALTNLIYCRAGAKIAVLAPASMPALYFWDLAAQSGLDFRIGYFPAADPSRGIHSDFTVDFAALVQLTGPAGSMHDQEKMQVSR